MSHKSFARMATLVLLALLAALIPLKAYAGGVCGGSYTIEKGDTVNSLAAMCGTSTAAIFAANPGLKEPLTPGQVINIPGPNYGMTATPTLVPPVTPVVTQPVTQQPVSVVNNYYNNYYYGYGPVPLVQPAPVMATSTYTVQPGDTFAGVAYSFGVSIYDLWAVNPYITDINMIYVGQVLNIPGSVIYPNPGVVTAATEPSALSYAGTIPHNAPQGTVRLVNKTDGDVYISLRSNRADGTMAINEFPVNKSFNTDIPVGWIDYVAWVGGVKFTGGFKLSENSIHTITFNRSKVVVD